MRKIDRQLQITPLVLRGALADTQPTLASLVPLLLAGVASSVGSANATAAA